MKYSFLFFFTITFSVSLLASDARSNILFEAFQKLSPREKVQLIKGLRNFYGRADLVANKKASKKIVYLKKFVQLFEAHAQETSSKRLCIYGGFYSQIVDGGQCTHPLNLEEENPYKKTYTTQCEETNQDKDLCNNTNYNACNPLLFGTKRNLDITKNAGPELSEYTTFMCYLDSSSSKNNEDNLKNVYESLRDKKNLESFIQLIKESLEICLCGNSETINQEYVEKINGTSTCEGLLLQISNFLKKYSNIIDAETCTTKNQFGKVLDHLQKIDDPFKEDSLKTSQLNFTDNDTSLEIEKIYTLYKKTNNEVATKLRNDTGFCVPPLKENQLSEKEQNEEANCELKFELSVDCEDEKECSVTPTLKKCDDDKEKYTIKYYSNNPKEAGPIAQLHEELREFADKSTGINVSSSSEKEASSGSTQMFSKGDEAYLVKYKVYKKKGSPLIKTAEISAKGEKTENEENEQEEPAKGCEPTLSITNSCDNPKTVTLSCDVKATLSYDKGCDKEDPPEEKTLNWKISEDLHVLEDLDQEGTMKTGSSKNFKKAPAGYTVEFKGSDLSGSTKIPPYNQAKYIPKVMSKGKK